MQQLDINREPPSREFLEQHVDAQRFLDFVSTRSPVFKERGLPRSKKKAIDLSKVIFGFDKDAYGKIGKGG